MKTKLLPLLAVFILFMAIPIHSSGQASGGLGFFAPGIHTIQYSSLNSSMPDGFPRITNKPFVTSGVGYGIFNNFVIGGEGGTMHAGSFTKDNQQVDLAGDFGFFSVGYVLFNKKGILFFPTVSIGSNDLSMYIHEKDHEASFSAITGEPFQATTLLQKTRMAKVAFTGIYAVKGSKSDQGTAGFMLGIQAGYQMGYSTGTWTYDGGAVTDGPDFSQNAFFIQLMIGGGGVMRK